jgi:hypothetical protein
MGKLWCDVNKYLRVELGLRVNLNVVGLKTFLEFITKLKDRVFS